MIKDVWILVEKHSLINQKVGLTDLQEKDPIGQIEAQEAIEETEAKGHLNVDSLNIAWRSKYL